MVQGVGVGVGVCVSLGGGVGRGATTALSLFNRPGVAGAVLKNTSVPDSFIKSSFVHNLQVIVHPKP